MFCPSLSAYRAGQHWHATTESNEWHSACFRRWQHLYLNSLIGFVSCFRHYQSQNSTCQTLKSLRNFRHSIVVWFLSLWMDSNGDHWQQQFKTSFFLLWCAAGLCPRPCFIHLVHKTTFKLDHTSFYLQSIFCSWHSTSWFLPSRSFGHHCPVHEELHFWSKLADWKWMQQAETN